ncbi:hypothetical protein ILUMI_16119 [Ignelater luminosus]|uniref:DDE-1 domain-containing protein n=1 Tax=Ignelater luminosus TaxID=2038154 RepID=A0A8K0G8H5_IGNLU|nr:hypothetical protein ILUMI_16119 [Ignelater luminosus]
MPTVEPPKQPLPSPSSCNNHHLTDGSDVEPAVEPHEKPQPGPSSSEYHQVLKCGDIKFAVDRCFTNLKSLYEKRQYSPSSIYNMDETGLSTVPNKLPKDLARKGKKLVRKVASVERVQLVTAICCRKSHRLIVPWKVLSTKLDIGYFGPLKCAYSHECDKIMISNPGKVITQLQVGKLFNAAYIAVANIEKAINSFKASAIFPFNPDKFKDVDFAPSLVTDMSRIIDEEIETDEETAHQKNVEVEQAAVEVHSVIEQFNIEGIEDQSPDILHLEVECKDGIVIPSIQFRRQDTPHNMSFTISNILPLLTIQNRPCRKSRVQKSEILFSSPFKNKLEELENTKRMKPVKKVGATKHIQ